MKAFTIIQGKLCELIKVDFTNWASLWDASYCVQHKKLLPACPLSSIWGKLWLSGRWPHSPSGKATLEKCQIFKKSRVNSQLIELQFFIKYYAPIMYEIQTSHGYIQCELSFILIVALIRSHQTLAHKVRPAFWAGSGWIEVLPFHTAASYFHSQSLQGVVQDSHLLL